jgi:hypothetical protein
MLAQLINYRVISPGLPKSSSFCQTCKSAIGDLQDVDSVENVGCCRSCEHQFYEPNREAWQKGWRPTLEEVKAIRDLRLFVPR